MIRLKPVTEEDCMKTWRLANDAQVRTASFSSAWIPYESHVKWFKSKLNDPQCQFYIAVDDQDEFVGQLRFDQNGDQATISVSVNRKFRGRGHGAQLIQLGLQNFFESSEAEAIHAYIKHDNIASLKAFQKTGFKLLDKLTVAGIPAYHLTLDRSV